MAGSALSHAPVATLRSDAAAAQAADLAACKALLREGSRTFLAASMLLPAAVRDPACALYAFCRLADDAVDAPGVPAYLALQSLRERLAAIYAGRPCDMPADRALARVVVRFAVPRGLLDALLDGFAWDGDGRRYRTLDDLLAYAARVAGSVGAVMALLMDTRSAQAVARACELGCAMQLTNIARDVGEDARLGRVYLPTDWLHEAGVDVDAWLARPVFTPQIGAVTERLLRAADALYARVGAGVALLPLACRPGIDAARFLYADIGNQVRRDGLDSVTRRAVVPRRRKLVLLLRAGGRLPLAPRALAPLDVLPATRFLIDLVAPQPPSATAPALSLESSSVMSSEPPTELSTEPPHTAAREHGAAREHSAARRAPAVARSHTARILELFERQEHRRLERRAPAALDALHQPPRSSAAL